MKKQIFKNRFFYTTLVFAVLILVQTAQFVYSQWNAPKSPPTGGQPAAPIDTSGASQLKSGNLRVEDESGNYVGLFKGGQIIFSAGGKEGAIRFNGDELQYRNSAMEDFLSIGSGGGGESFWKEGIGGIFYDGGDVSANSFCLMGGASPDCVSVAKGGWGGDVWVTKGDDIFYDRGADTNKGSITVGGTPHGTGAVEAIGAGPINGLTVNNNNKTGRLWMDSSDNVYLTNTDNPEAGLVITPSGVVNFSRGVSIGGNFKFSGSNLNLSAGNSGLILDSDNGFVIVGEKGFKIAKTGDTESSVDGFFVVGWGQEKWNSSAKKYFCSNMGGVMKYKGGNGEDYQHCSCGSYNYETMANIPGGGSEDSDDSKLIMCFYP